VLDRLAKIVVATRPEPALAPAPVPVPPPAPTTDPRATVAAAQAFVDRARLRQGGRAA
jgi:hypothetical protein